MSDYACAGLLTEHDLESLLAVPPAPLDWLILEAVDEVKLEPYRVGIEPGKCQRGRAFGHTCEIRWEQTANAFHTVLIGDIAEAPVALASDLRELSASDFSLEDGSYFLWGEWSHNDPRWLEASIPHVFDYPTPAGDGKWRIKLQTKEYLNRSDGEMAFYRFVGLTQPLPESEW